MCPWVAQLVKESARNVEDRGSIPGSGRPSGGGHGNPLQCSCLENPHGERGWRAAVHGVAELDTPERASTSIFRGDVALEELHGHGHENWSLFVPTSLRKSCHLSFAGAHISLNV